MALPGNDIFLFFIVDENGVSWYVDDNGAIQRMFGRPLDHAPKGWQDMTINYMRNTTYQGLDRTYSDTFAMAKDGARICRWLLFNSGNKGFETKAWMCIAKKDPDMVQGYSLYYKAEIDLTQTEDSLRDYINITLIEGGAAKSIKTNENTTYELTPGDVTIFMDGIVLLDTDNWQGYQIELGGLDPTQGGWWTFPLVFINSDGDSVGVEFNSQTPERIGAISGGTTYFRDSANYFFRNQRATNGVRAFGRFVYTPTITGQAPEGTTTMFYLVRESDDMSDIFNSGIHLGTVTGEQENIETSLSFDVSFDVPTNDKVFLIVLPVSGLNPGDIQHVIRVRDESRISFNIETKSDPTNTKAYRPITLFKELCSKISGGKYTGFSTLLSGNTFNITSGDALRMIKNAVIKTTFRDFFDTFSKELDGALGVDEATQTIRFEARSWFMDNSIQIMDIGEVEGLVVSIANDLIYNTATVGYPDQNYEQRAGRQEFNSEQKWVFPITRIQKDFDLKIPYRADGYGIEYIRAKFNYQQPTPSGGSETNDATTDNSGDNDVFLIDAVPGFAYTGVTVTNAGSNAMTIGSSQVAAELAAFTTGDKIIVQGTTSYNGTYTLTEPPRPTGTVGTSIFFVAETVPGGFGQSGSVNMPNNLRLRRDFTAVTGVNTDTIFNTELSPHKMLLRNASYLRAICYGTPSESVKFTSALKNAQLAVTRGGTTILENAPIPLLSLPDSFYRPIYFNFNTKVPENIIKLLKNTGKGYVKFQYAGVELFGFVQEVSVKPAYNDAQQWRLLCSSLTTLAALETLSPDNLNINGMGVISNTLPCKFVPYGDVIDPRYHNRTMDQDWFQNRLDIWANQRGYFQKVQYNDTTTIQVISKSSVSAEIFRCGGGKVQTITTTAIPSGALPPDYQLFQFTVNWGMFLDGTYTILLTCGSKKFVSEPFQLQEIWDHTMLVEYTHTGVRDSIIWNVPFVGQFRIDSHFQNYAPMSRYSSYDDESMDRETISGVSYDTYELYIGSGGPGVADWAMRLVNKILLLDSVYIDGTRYARNDDGEELQMIDVNGSKAQFATIRLRVADNRDGLDTESDQIGSTEFVEEFNIDMAGFSGIDDGNPDPGESIVTVRRVN